MPREFADQKALVDYAEENGLEYEYEYTPAFAKWQRLLSPEQYEIAGARTSRGISRVMLLSKAITQPERESNAAMRDTMAIKRERLRGTGEKLAAERTVKQRRSLQNHRFVSSRSALARSSPSLVPCMRGK